MIGFYDSGVGGLSIVNEFLKLRPRSQIIYLADNQNCPLGNKSSIEILEITKNGVEFLFDQGCYLVILACNTATSVAIRYLQQNWLPNQSKYKNRKILGVIKPITEQIDLENQTQKPILLMATKATCDSNFYQSELKLAGYTSFDCLPFADLALAIENSNFKLAQDILDTVFEHFDIFKYELFVLACTHYPLIYDLIYTRLEQRLNKPFKLLDQSKIVAFRLDKYLQKHTEIKPEMGLVKVYITHGQPVDYKQKVQRLFSNIEFEVEKV